MGIYVKYSYWPKKGSTYDFANSCETSELLVPEVLIPSKEVAQDVISKLFSRRDVIVTSVLYAAVYVGEIKLQGDDSQVTISDYPDLTSVGFAIAKAPAPASARQPEQAVAQANVSVASVVPVPQIETEGVVPFIEKRFPDSSHALFRKENQFYSPVDKSLAMMRKNEQLTKDGQNTFYCLTISKRYQILARVDDARKNKQFNILLNDNGKMIFAPEEDFTASLATVGVSKDDSGPDLNFPNAMADDDGDIRAKR